MNNTFNFEKEHPELYAEVQADEARKKRISRLTLLISIAINLAICGVLLYSDINPSVSLIIVAWVSFSTVFPVRIILDSLVS